MARRTIESSPELAGLHPIATAGPSCVGRIFFRHGGTLINLSQVRMVMIDPIGAIDGEDGQASRIRLRLADSSQELSITDAEECKALLPILRQMMIR